MNNRNKNYIFYLFLFILILYLGMEILIPLYVEKQVERELTNHFDDYDNIEVEVNSFPPWELLFSMADRVKIKADLLNYEGIVLKDIAAYYQNIIIDDGEIRGKNTDLFIKVTEDDLNNHPHYTGKQIGDIWLKDINGYDEDGNLTGEPDGKIDAADRDLITTQYPDLEYGAMGSIGYKNLTLQLQLKGMQGRERDIRGGVNQGLLHYFTRWAMNHSDLVLDRFHPTKNPDGEYPRVSIDDSGNNTMFSDFWLRDASFLRIKNVNLSYELPDNLIRSIGIGKLSAYISVQNLYTFTQFPAPNVDSNADDLTGIPQPRTWTMGMRATF
ncbi:MAG: LmeA family phospholipid-binding protein [Halanaerobiaceae bacterium]